MQDLLTLTLETLAIATALMMFADFFGGLTHLYYACATTQKDQPEEAIAFEPTPIDPDETAPLDDAWVGEIEVISQCCCLTEASPVLYLLPPATPGVIDQPETVDYSGWTIRALKKEAQNRKLSKYSSLTKAQLVATLTAA